MKIKPENPYAFPVNDNVSLYKDIHGQIIGADAGMTLRDYFAAKALQSYMINCNAMKVNDGFIDQTMLPDLAKYSYQIADAMLAERTKPNE